MSFDENEPAGAPGFPMWMRVVALVLIVALVGFYVVSALF